MIRKAIIIVALFGVAGTAEADPGALLQVDCAHPPSPSLLPVVRAAAGVEAKFEVRFGHPSCDQAGDPISATITWGDGSSSRAKVTPDAHASGQWIVAASHDFTKPGRYNVTVDTLNGRTGIRLSSRVEALVGPAGRYAIKSDLRWDLGKRFDGAVATLRVGETGRRSADYRAQISWGDGSRSPGRITIRRGRLTVDGRHTWRTRPKHPRVAIVVTDRATRATLRLTRSLSIR